MSTLLLKCSRNQLVWKARSEDPVHDPPISRTSRSRLFAFQIFVARCHSKPLFWTRIQISWIEHSQNTIRRLLHGLSSWLFERKYVLYHVAAGLWLVADENRWSLKRSSSRGRMSTQTPRSKYIVPVDVPTTADECLHCPSGIIPVRPAK